MIAKNIKQTKKQLELVFYKMGFKWPQMERNVTMIGTIF
jgi:hypothetical protein